MRKKQCKNKSIVKETNLSYEDYAMLDDGMRYELVKGQLELMGPSPSTVHQLISSEIYNNLNAPCASDYFILYAPIDVILSPHEVRQPDIALVHRARIDILTNRGIEGAPDLVVEILSPSSIKRDKIDKIKTYAEYNIPEYWIVDPKSGVLEQFVLIDDHYELADIFQGAEEVTSPKITCASFTMKMVMDEIPELED